MFGRVSFTLQGAVSTALRTQLGPRPLHVLARVQTANPHTFPKRAISLTHVLQRENSEQDGEGRASMTTNELRIPSGSVYIANVPFKATAAQLQEAFSQFGQVRGVVLMKTAEGLPRGQGFIEFETAKDAENFVESDRKDPILLLDRDIFVQHSNIRIDPRRQPTNTLVAQHFSPGSEDLVRKIFRDYADSLRGVRIPGLQDCSGYAFVQFNDTATATKALHDLNARMIPEINRLLRLQYSRSSRPPSLATRLSQRAELLGGV